MNRSDLPEDSDSSDEDYNPEGNVEVVSEEDSDGDPEDPLPQAASPVKRNKKQHQKSKRLRRDSSDGEPSNTPALTEQEQKKKADDLWADFQKDTGFKKKDTSTNSPESPAKPKSDDRGDSKIVESKPAETVKVTEIFHFAGEEVKIEKQVPAHSTKSTMSTTPPAAVNRRSGLSSVLTQLKKKNNITTLEKSKMDWDKFKKDEKIEDELVAHNKGKNGYLDRQDFLQRADERRFEIEKGIRTTLRNNRMNNLP